MRFLEKANICDTVIAPVNIEKKTEREAKEIAVSAAESLDTTGVLAVELFETGDGRILLNEVAPRPHNSGHLTIEGAYTSQFEQHIRAVCGLPLGSTELKQAAVMKNLLGRASGKGHKSSPEQADSSLPPRAGPAGTKSDRLSAGRGFFSPMVRGKVRISGMPEALSIPGVFLHLYGKGESRPYRKMGHLTALAESAEAAIQKAEEAAGHIVIE
jgi:5-(carboxyamino)imidazole ribonucleotide synthase